MRNIIVVIALVFTASCNLERALGIPESPAPVSPVVDVVVDISDSPDMVGDDEVVEVDMAELAAHPPDCDNHLAH